MWALRKGKWGVLWEAWEEFPGHSTGGRIKLRQFNVERAHCLITRQGGSAAALYKTPSDTEGRGGGTYLWSFCPEALPSWVCLERSSVTAPSYQTHCSKTPLITATASYLLRWVTKVTSCPSLPSSRIPMLPSSLQVHWESLFVLPSRQKHEMPWGTSLLLK